MLWFTVLWFGSGFSFWLSSLFYNGLPRQWKSVNREDGWDEVLFIWLPIVTLGGPIWWIAFVAIRVASRLEN